MELSEKAGEKVAFLQIKNYCIETFENGQAAMSDGAYQHVALDVEDIESMYQKICNEKYTIITDGIEELPFWENGVKFFDKNRRNIWEAKTKMEKYR